MPRYKFNKRFKFNKEEFNKEEFSSGASYLVAFPSYKQFVRGGPVLGRKPDEHDIKGNLFCAPTKEIDRLIEKSRGDLNKLEKLLGFDPGWLGDGPIHRVDIKVPQNHNLRGATGYESSANCFFATPLGEDGKMPEIKFVKDTKGKTVWKDNCSVKDEKGNTVWTGWCEVIDTKETKPDELKKLKGKYITDTGVVHAPDLSDYNYRTSGGFYEGVVDQVPNTPECVSHYIIYGWKRGKDAELDTIVSKRPFREMSEINNHFVHTIVNTSATKTQFSAAKPGPSVYNRTRTNK